MAAELTTARRASDAERIVKLRDTFLNRLMKNIPGVMLNGHSINRLPNIVNISIEGVEGPTLLMNLDRKGVYASSGSACSSGSIEPSHVLKAIGLSNTLASGGIRFSLGRTTTMDELNKTVEVMSDIVTILSGRNSGNK